ALVISLLSTLSYTTLFRSWLPGFLWRISKFWRGVRAEVPWVDRSPAEIVRDHVRLTITPFDAPDDVDTVERIIDQLRSDELLLRSESTRLNSSHDQISYAV